MNLTKNGLTNSRLDYVVKQAKKLNFQNDRRNYKLSKLTVLD